MTEPSYHPRETGRSPKEEGTMDVWACILVVAWFITIISAIQISGAAMAFDLDVLAMVFPSLLFSVLVTIFWIWKKVK
ncbi:MAG: hypothetical protein ACFFAX_05050 [Promethearchaeota archaeon]